MQETERPRPVDLVDINLTFNTVLYLVILIVAAQLLLAAVIGGVVGVFYLAVIR